MSDTIVIESAIHGERVWRRVGERQQIHGKPRRLGVWETACLICGKPFTITTAAASTDVRFTILSCPEHRLSHEEGGRLFRGPDERRRAAFEKIKAEKLGLSPPSPASE